MAKAPKEKGKPKKKKSGFAMVVGWFVAPLLSLLFVETFILIVAGMIPTIVAYIIDTSKTKHLTRTVGYMNMFGCVAVALEMWLGDNSIAKSLSLLADPFNWLMMFGAASMGWALTMLLPPIVATYLVVIDDVRMKTLIHKQRDLIKEWGTSVKDHAPVEAEDLADHPEVKELMAKYSKDTPSQVQKTTEGEGGEGPTTQA